MTLCARDPDAGWFSRVPETTRAAAMNMPLTDVEEKRYAELQLVALECARHGDTETLDGMLRHGLPANLSDTKGQSLLMLASYHGHLETARLLLEHDAEVDRRNDRGQTPLGGVSFKGYEDLAALLLDHGADIDADNGGGATPLMLATMFGRTGVADLLKRRGAATQPRRRLSLSCRLLKLAAPVLRWIVRPAARAASRA